MLKLISEYIEHGKRKGLKSFTLGDYERKLRRFFYFITENYPDIKEITEITKDVVRDYEKYLAVCKDSRGKIMSVNRRKKHLATLKSFFDYLQLEEKIVRNPAINIAMPKERDNILRDVLSVDEMEILLKACSGHSMKSLRDRAILELLYSTALRADELCGVEVKDFDFDKQFLFVRNPKLGRERIIPFGDSASYWVKRYLEKVRQVINNSEKTDLLFITFRQGRRLSNDILCRIIKDWSKVSGLEKAVTTHTFRHSCASHMIKFGADIRFVQRHLGHKNISTTEKYLRIEISDLKEVHARTHPREREEW